MSTNITYRRIWSVTWPIILSNLTIPLVGAVDTAVIGRLPGAQYIAAIAIGAIIFDFLFWGLNFLKIGTSGLTAQAWGRNQPELAGRHISRALFIALIATAIILVSQSAIFNFASFIFKVEPDVINATQTYFFIRIWGCGFVLINFVLLGSFIALQKTNYLLAHQLILNISNIVLNLFFVIVLKLDVKGVAIATVIANFMACMIGMVMLTRYARNIGITISIGKASKEGFATYIPLMKLNTNIFIRTACLVFSFAFFTYMSTRLGTLFIAANAILLHFQTMMAYALDGFADACESFTGRAYGRGDLNFFKLTVKRTTVLAFIASLISSLIFLIFGHDIVALFTIDTNVLNLAQTYLPWVVISPVLSVWCFQLDGIYIGTTHTKLMRNGMLICTCLFIVTAWYFMMLWQNHGMWFSFLLFMVSRGLILAVWLPKITNKLA